MSLLAHPLHLRRAASPAILQLHRRARFFPTLLTPSQVMTQVTVAAGAANPPPITFAPNLDQRLQDALDARREANSCRTLTLPTRQDAAGSEEFLVDFSSNDYLGFARSDPLRRDVFRAMALLEQTHSTQGSAPRDRDGPFYFQQLSETRPNEHENGLAHMSASLVHLLTAPTSTPGLTGSTGSRLLTGNSRLYEGVERFLTAFFRAESGLVFNSGYDANLGLLGSLPQKGDFVFVDELAHASMNEGLRLSRGTKVAFRHNDLGDLEGKLRVALATSTASQLACSGSRAAASGASAQQRPSAIVAVESVYSMDGDCAPLRELVALCRKYGAHLVVDEAHGTGLFGAHGEGLVCHLGLEREVFARVHTFGKALGCHGAVVVASPTVREYLVNYARSLIYTTSLPPHSLVSAWLACEHLSGSGAERRERVAELVAHFRTRVQGSANKGLSLSLLDSLTPIQGVVVPGNAQVVGLARHLKMRGLNALPIRSPTVPRGSERLRIIIHAHNTRAEIDRLVAGIEEYFGAASRL